MASPPRDPGGHVTRHVTRPLAGVGGGGAVVSPLGARCWPSAGVDRGAWSPYRQGDWPRRSCDAWGSGKSCVARLSCCSSEGECYSDRGLCRLPGGSTRNSTPGRSGRGHPRGSEPWGRHGDDRCGGDASDVRCVSHYCDSPRLTRTDSANPSRSPKPARWPAPSTGPCPPSCGCHGHHRLRGDVSGGSVRSEGVLGRRLGTAGSS